MNHRDTTFSRQWKLIQLLGNTTRGLTLNELSEQTGYSRRTIQRHFALFRNNGLPLIEERHKETQTKTYRIALDDPKYTFTFDELVAIYTARHFMESMMDSFLWESIQSTLRKMRKTLGTQMIRFLERSVGFFSKTGFGWSDYKPQASMLDDLVTAIENQRCVTILYRSLSESKPSQTKVAPYGILHHEGSLYLVGFSHKRQAIRHWKIDRLHALTVIANETFEIDKSFSLSEHTANMFGIFQGETKSRHRVRIRFHSYWAQWVREKHWHPTERFEEHPDGTVVLELHVPELGPLKYWVLGFGRHAEVLEPQKLQEMIRTEIEQILAR